MELVGAAGHSDQISLRGGGDATYDIWTMRGGADIFAATSAEVPAAAGRARKGDRILHRAGSLKFRGEWRHALLRACAAAVLIVLPTIASRGDLVGSAADNTAVLVPADARKQPMRFIWYQNGPGARGVIAAVGTVTGDTPAAFEELAGSHDLRGATVVLDSGGGSVLDTLTLGRRFRALQLATTVGTAAERGDGHARRVAISPDAACESMCAFLLLAGSPRDVPPGARVRVHQIWMGDRAADAQAASYSAQDMAIVQRDVGRLAQYTFEMGGSGTLLALALSVPPWQPLHELSAQELIAAHLVTGSGAVAAAPNTAAPKPLQDRLAVSRTGEPGPAPSAGLGKAADAATGGMVRMPPATQP